MSDTFLQLSRILAEGYDDMRKMRGSDRNGFNYTMLENSLELNQQSFSDILMKNFDEELLQSVNEVCMEKGIETFSPSYLKELQQQYKEYRYQPPRYFFDMDGVLYKFDNTITSLDVLYEENYFYNLPQQKLAAHCMHKMLEQHPHQVYVLSHYLDSPFAYKEKTMCLHEQFPELEDCNIILVPYNEKKIDYVPQRLKNNDFLIDDYNKNLIEWKEEGGHAVKFVNPINDVNKTWNGERIYYDDPELIESLNMIVSHVEGLDNIDTLQLDTKIENQLHLLESEKTMMK